MEEIFGLQVAGHDVPMTVEPCQLEALAGICDPRFGPPKLAALKSLLLVTSLKELSYFLTLDCCCNPPQSPYALRGTFGPWSTWTRRELTTWAKLVVSWLCNKVKR